MKKLKITPRFTIFIIFFGTALFEAIQRHNWIEALLFVILAFVFLNAKD